MKRILLIGLVVAICLSATSAFATNRHNCVPQTPAHCPSFCIIDERHGHCIPRVPERRPDPCEPFVQITNECCDNYNRLITASSKSSAWAKYALDVLKQVIRQTGIDWTIVKTTTHTPSNNGWVEMLLRNTKTSEELYCVMNIHTRGDAIKSNRVCTFTYGHLINPSKRGKTAGVCYKVTPCFKVIKSEITTTGGLKLADYPAYYIIGSVGEPVETSIAHFVYWLSEDINHAMPLEALTNE